MALSVLTSGGVAAALATLFNGGLQRRLTARLEAAKNANAEKLKSVDASIAEADRKSALALRRDDSRMTTLLQINRMAADAIALAHNVTLPPLPDGTPIYPRRPYANAGTPTTEVERETARLLSDAYFFNPELGRAVTLLHEFRENLLWDATENRTPLEEFAEDDPLVVKLRDAAHVVRDHVQTMLTKWEY
ncbi:hypothetical protein EU78_17205 [Mycolicibacterium rufum]|nr:hypothetical protein EU78_17205 [Mycolicibacterium rufum]